MFPLNALTIKIGLFAIVFFGGLYLGYSMEHSRLVAYQASVEATGKAQEAKNEQIVKQQQVTTERITNDYKNSLTRIHTYYSGMHVNPSSSAMSVTSTTVPFVDGTPSDPQFVEKCAMTTQQLESLQEWVREQVGIK
jgi:hypothetical protein